MTDKMNVIAKLRKEAGFTQKTLAEALHVTDKAISKWERGLSMPDIALLPKLSALLDADIELLLHEKTACMNKGWAGLIDLRNYPLDPAVTVHDKPLIDYLLSHFLLMNIRDIYVLGKAEQLEWTSREQLQAAGFCFHKNPERMPKTNLMIMHHPCFLFGADLTRRFQAAISTNKITKLCPAWDITPFLFCPAEYSYMYYTKPRLLYENAVLKTLGRGMVCLPLDTPGQINDAAAFVRMYQNNTGLTIHDLREIARSLP